MLRSMLREAGSNNIRYHSRTLKSEIEELLPHVVQSKLDQLRQCCDDDRSAELTYQHALASVFHTIAPTPQELSVLAQDDAFFVYVKHLLRPSSGDGGGGDAAASSTSDPAAAATTTTTTTDAADDAAAAASAAYKGLLKRHNVIAYQEPYSTTRRDLYSVFQIQSPNLNAADLSNSTTHRYDPKLSECLKELVGNLKFVTKQSDLREIEIPPDEVAMGILWLWTSPHDRMSKWLLPENQYMLPPSTEAPTPASCVTRDVYSESVLGTVNDLSLLQIQDCSLDDNCMHNRTLRAPKYRSKFTHTFESGNAELLSLKESFLIAKQMKIMGQVDDIVDAGEWARLVNTNSVPEVAALCVSAAKDVSPFTFKNSTITFNQAWVNECSRLLYAASLRLALLPGIADMDLTSPQITNEHQNNNNIAETGEHVAQRLPRVHRSIQMYVSLCITDDIVNDTMKPLEERLLFGQNKYDHDDDDSSSDESSSCSSSNDDDDDDEILLKGELNAAALATEAWQRATRQRRNVIGWRRLQHHDVPEITLPFASCSDTHNADFPKQKTTRLISNKPKFKQNYNRKMQGPPKTTKYHQEEFVNPASKKSPNLMATSYVREHALRAFQQKHFVPLEEMADPVWRTFEDFDNCVRAPLTNVFSKHALLPHGNKWKLPSLGDPLPTHYVRPRSNKTNKAFAGETQICNKDLTTRAKEIFKKGFLMENVIVPTEALIVDQLRSRNDRPDFAVRSFRSSLADTILSKSSSKKAHSGENVSFRKQLDAAQMLSNKHPEI